MAKHRLSVSRDGVIKSLRNQFTRSTTFLSEALQNSRRAQATGVWVEWDSGVMLIRDDGKGIKDFKALFTLGRSGWDAETVAQENPFGVGFMACVLASVHIDIRTLSSRAAFSTRDLLNFVAVEVSSKKTNAICGTELRLSLNPSLEPGWSPASGGTQPLSLEERWKRVLEQMVLGFPIPVYFNGVALPRPHALNSGLKFLETEVGQLYVKGLSKCNTPEHVLQPHLYCQGLPIQRDEHQTNHSADVLHLDSRRFRVRMPDRDVLIDAKEGLQKIREALMALWRKRLIERYAEIPRQEFVDLYWLKCVSWDLEELLRDAPLARSMLEQYGSQVTALTWNTGTTKSWEGPLPGREAVFIKDLGENFNGIPGDPPAPLASVYALHQKLPVLDSRVPSCHGAPQRVVNLLDEELQIEYELIGATRTAKFKSDRILCDVICCESYTILFRPTVSCDVPASLRSHLTPITVTDQAFYDPVRRSIIVPAGEWWVGDVVGQVSSYEDGNRDHREGEYENDQTDLQCLVDSLRADSPQAYLTTLLSRLSPDPTLLGDRIYQVRYDGSNHQFVVTVP